VYKILSKLVDECWRYSEPKQCHFWAWLKRPIFGVHDSQGSAETLIRRGGIANNHLIAYSISNISAKNYQKRLMCIEVIAYNVIVFFETQCTALNIASRGKSKTKSERTLGDKFIGAAVLRMENKIHTVKLKNATHVMFSNNLDKY